MEDIAKAFPRRNMQNCSDQLSQLFLKNVLVSRKPQRFFTEDDDRTIYSLHKQNFTVEQMCQSMRRSPTSIRFRLRLLRLKENPVKKGRRVLWTITELEKLRKTLNERVDVSKSAALFPQRTYRAVLVARALLRKESGESKWRMRRWTNDEDQELLALTAQIHPAREQSSNKSTWETIAEKLGRTVSSVDSRCKYLRREDRLKKALSGNALSANDKASISDSVPQSSP